MFQFRLKNLIHSKLENNFKSIRPFIGSKNFEISCEFYRYIGFEEKIVNPKMSVFSIGNLAFYLQDADVKDWIDNTMVFVEVYDLPAYHNKLSNLQLATKFDGARLSAIKIESWGSECFLHDPSGILWHFGKFN